MSSGIVLLNKGGLAVAADSAITIGNRSAIFHTQKKIYQVGLAPVVIVFYGNAMFSNIPIEVVLNQFDRYMKKQPIQKQKLLDYFKEFVQFIEENADFFQLKNQEKDLFEHYTTNVVSYYLQLAQNHIGKRTIIHELESYIEKIKQRLENNKNHEEKPFVLSWDYVLKEHSDVLTVKYQHYFEKNFQRNFQEEPLDEGDKEVLSFLNQICALQTSNTFFFDRIKTGMCFAGYGEQQLYPSLFHFTYYGYAQNHLLFEPILNYEINDEYPRGILTLAQDDVMQAVIRGVDSNIKETIQSHYEEQAYQFFNQEKNQSKQSLDVEKMANRYQEHFEKKLDIDSQIKFYSKKIFTTVQLLPVKDLADFAENLINIQIIRRKYETDKENNGTVGGPTDVVVVTKTEGVHWIKNSKS